jgi:hypothetical protein
MVTGCTAFKAACMIDNPWEVGGNGTPKIF